MYFAPEPQGHGAFRGIIFGAAGLVDGRSGTICVFKALALVPTNVFTRIDCFSALKNSSIVRNLPHGITKRTQTLFAEALGELGVRHVTVFSPRDPQLQPFPPRDDMRVVTERQ